MAMRIDVSGVLSWWDTVEIEIAFHLFQTVRLRHILQDQDHPRQLPSPIPDGCRIEREIALLSLHEPLKDLLLLIVMLLGTLVTNDLPKQLVQLVERQILEAGSGLDAENVSGGIRRYFDLSLQIHDRHGLGQGVEGFLSRLLGADQFRLIAAAKFPETGRHVVERLRQPADLVPGIRRARRGPGFPPGSPRRNGSDG